MPVPANQSIKGPSLGEGAYTLAEASRYTRLHPSRTRAWFKGRSDQTGRGPLLRSDFAKRGSDFAVSFLDLVDLAVAGEFRKLGVTMPVVRRAYSQLVGELQTEHPFCHSDLYTDGREIFLHTAGEIGDEALANVVSQQRYFLHVIQQLKRIDYSEATRLAMRWRVASGVLIDPEVSFGKPVAAGTGVTTYVLAQAFFANRENAEFVADLYGVTPQAVENAVDFEQEHGARHAA